MAKFRQFIVEPATKKPAAKARCRRPAKHDGPHSKERDKTK